MPEVWPVGSWVVLLDKTPVQVALTSAQRRIARHYRIGPARRGYDDPSYVHRIEAFDGNGLRPYSPCHLRVEATLSGDMRLSWVRRTRIDGDDWDLVEVPLGEEREAYRVRVIQAGSVLREVSVDVPEWTYSAAMQSADGLAAPARLEVAQVSARYGPGPAAGLDLAG